MSDAYEADPADVEALVADALAAAMHDSGMSYAKIAEALNLTRARAQQLVEAGR